MTGWMGAAKRLLFLAPWVVLAIWGGCWACDRVEERAQDRVAETKPQVLEASRKARGHRKRPSRLCPEIVALEPTEKARKAIQEKFFPGAEHPVLTPEDKRELLRQDEVPALPRGGELVTLLDTTTGEIQNRIVANPEPFFDWKKSGGVGGAYTMSNVLTDREAEYRVYLWTEPLKIDRGDVRLEAGYGDRLGLYVSAQYDVDLFSK